jgi:g-D-glutamyl-meso-diaminopimelate peptidase
LTEMSIQKYGSSGPDTELLQKALSRSGRKLTIDGIFGNSTKNALLSFQASRGLATDGIAGTATWRALTPYLTGYITYTIKKGDTLYKIARANATTVESIETANPGLVPMNLIPGRKITVPLNFDVVPADITFTSAAAEFSVSGLRARYPFISVYTIGKSVMGKPIQYMRLGMGVKNVFFNASHHGNEWITTPILLRYLENFCRALVSGGDIGGKSAAELYTGATIWFVPMVNPDGVDLASGRLTEGRFYNEAATMSQNYPSIPFPSGWKANISGIDTNLQYPAGWEIAREIKTAQGYFTPGPRDYVGDYPLQAPESRAVYDFTNSHNFDLTVSYHTQGRVIYWKYGTIEPPRGLEIGTYLSAASGYTLDNVPDASGHAGYKDWFILEFNRPGYTVEAGYGTNPLPISDFPAVYAENEGLISQAIFLV